MNFEVNFNPVYMGKPPFMEGIELLPEETRELLGFGNAKQGKILRFRFENNYGASVITHAYSFGGVDEWELAVIYFTTGSHEEDGEFELNYDTPVSDDVIGCLSWDKVEELLTQIKALPDRTPPNNVYEFKA